MSVLHRAIIADRDIEYALSEMDSSSFKLTTMTILVSLSSRIDIRAIQEDNVPGWNIIKGRFLNALMFKAPGKKISIKVFSNGNLHMTGVKSVREALDNAEKVVGFLEGFFECKWSITGFSIQLINGCFGFQLDENMQLCLNTLQSLIPNDIFTVFQPESHPGLRVKLSDTVNPHKQASVIVFRSGKVLINAFVSGRHLLRCYKFINELFLHNKASILKGKQSSHKFKGFDYGKYLA